MYVIHNKGLMLLIRNNNLKTRKKKPQGISSFFSLTENITNINVLNFELTPNPI